MVLLIGLQAYGNAYPFCISKYKVKNIQNFFEFNLICLGIKLEKS